jgi:hypothetical protein
MADIKELGESLLARSKKRNDDRFERDRKESYKIALATAGGKLLSGAMKQRTSDFLNSEEMFAARAKQRAGYTDAQQFIQEQDRVNASGMSGTEYYSQQLYPTIKAQADLQIKNGGMTEESSDNYEAFLRQEAATAGKNRWLMQQEGYNAASNIESPESFTEFQRMQAARAGSNGNVLINGVKRLFGGKSRSELESETLSAITNSSSMQNAEAVSAIRSVYNNTGSINIAASVAEAIADKTITPGRGEQVFLKNVGEPKIVKGPGGEQYSVVTFANTDSEGRMIADENGAPSLFTEQTRISGVGSGDREFSSYIENLTEGAKTSQARALSVAASQSDTNTQAAYQSYVDKQGEEGKAQVAEMQAGIAAKMVGDYGIREDYAQAISSQLFLNRVEQGYKKGGTFSPDQFNFLGVDMSTTPTTMDIIETIGQLEQSSSPLNIEGSVLAPLMQGNISERIPRCTRGRPTKV